MLDREYFTQLAKERPFQFLDILNEINRRAAIILRQVFRVLHSMPVRAETSLHNCKLGDDCVLQKREREFLKMIYYLKHAKCNVIYF